MSRYFNFFRLLFTDPRRCLIRILTRKRFFKSDERQVKVVYRLEMGKRLNLEKPKLFSEKLQWLKLYDRKSEYTIMVDKYAVKEYVARKIGVEYIIPTLAVWDNVEDIDFDTLPEQFVLKVTHGGGGSGVSICEDRDKYNKNQELARLRKWLSVDGYSGRCEWPYRDVRKRVIAEKFIQQEGNCELKDYKFFCFAGKVKFFKVDFGRFTEHHANYYDAEGELLPFGESDYYPDFNHEEVMPDNLSEMIEVAEELSKGQKFLRVDLYNVNSKIYFGELTFYPASGVGKFTPAEYDLIIGSYLKLPIEL